jgi:fructokinase
VFDVNLRPPFDSPEVVWSLCADADLIKLNDDELAKLMSRKRDLKTLEQDARAFGQRAGCDKICVTAGSKGAGLLWNDDWLWEDARPVEVKDTIGAGDSFLAGLMRGWLLRNENPSVILKGACRLSEFVAGCDGAMPAYSLSPTGAIQPI